MNKDEWIKRAEAELTKATPGWTPSALHDYADGLFDTYAMNDGGFEDDPEGAVQEDLTYWE